MICENFSPIFRVDFPEPFPVAISRIARHFIASFATRGRRVVIRGFAPGNDPLDRDVFHEMNRDSFRLTIEVASVFDGSDSRSSDRVSTTSTGSRWASARRRLDEHRPGGRSTARGTWKRIGDAPLAIPSDRDLRRVRVGATRSPPLPSTPPTCPRAGRRRRSPRIDGSRTARHDGRVDASGRSSNPATEIETDPFTGCHPIERQERRVRDPRGSKSRPVLEGKGPDPGSREPRVPWKPSG